MTTEWFFGLIFSVFSLATILLLIGTWQHTRIIGFLLVAVSYLLGMIGRWIAPLAYRLAQGEMGAADWIFPLVQATFVIVSALALWGFWDIYRSLKRSAIGAS